ncbi:3-oxoacyl-ACP synthase [Cochleicola gelatinilyticus]|uniref:3-oxoacyl-ACP synthase n=1 Tax=Cochleicola gelatinilyticus TaxID=1763537 RepID=A0A167J306_9FLAO|nr:3-oxoacyl-ACP synthase [Cochleicola gelatinilyticus]OAB80283.1 3-oxoacyl-ACP synthase [Cochleicola gelatinilyticus]
MTVKEIKEALLKECKNVVAKRFDKIKQTIEDIIESLEDESKSSAGDKHETGRAMLQIDRENAGKQLREIETLQKLLPRIDIDVTSDYGRLGSLVYTNQGTYFLSISIGAVTVSKTVYYCVALHSPIGDLLSGKKKGDLFSFNGKDYKVTSVK